MAWQDGALSGQLLQDRGGVRLVVSPMGQQMFGDLHPGPARTQGRVSYVRDPCCVSRRTFGLADAQVPHSYVGTEERCAAVSDGGRCRPRDRAPPSLRAGDHRAYPLVSSIATRR
jgi:hypothetical protein